MSLLEVRELNAGYGRVQVLWSVDLAVEAKQIVALVGANGAGKSTLLRAISGMIPVRSGRIEFAGRDITRTSIESIVDLGIAHVPEGRRLFSGLTVRENLLLGGWRNKKRDLSDVVDLFPVLGGRMNQVASTLSGGEQQMCAIGRALMGQPALLMIDELSLGLAPILVDEIMARLPQIAESGTAVLLVEQDIDAALAVSQFGYVLETGRIMKSGLSRELLADPTIQQAYLGLGKG
ncbi:MAG TPA: ABC transporter ATP-binding protein [Candidatus Dormibacteraeota bacterium]|nr:ABC transporter ATP-binding protein [Candidatus Dormibacteraeota bacterium]